MLEPGPAGEDAAHAPARPADRPDHDHGGHRAGARGRLRADPRRRLRRPVRDRHQPRDRGDPDGPARGRHDDALARDAGARGEGRDREAAAVGRDARLDLGDLLGQDRHADAQPDDRARARRRRAAATRSRARATRPRARSSASRARRTPRSTPFLLPMALANDAAVRDGEIVGDPTEAALVVLAAKGGLDVDETRRVFPRVGEVPFDSEYKFMATFHEMEDDGRKVVRCFVKGAPDVLLARSSHDPGRRRRAVPAEGARDRVLAENDRLAGDGLRVLAVATRDIDPAASTPAAPARRGAGPDAARAGRHRRPAAQGGEGRDRALQGGRHPRPHDHRRPRHDRRRDRGAARDRGAGADRHRVRGAQRRGARRAGRRDRRRRPGRARGQGAARRHAEAQGQRRLDDRRRGQRRARRSSAPTSASRWGSPAPR